MERGQTFEPTVTDGSISKYYNLYPENPIDEEVTIYYLDSADFEGINSSEKDFRLWTSYTNGYYYTNKYGKVDTAGNFVSTNGETIPVNKPTRITISDEICDNPPVVNLGADTIHFCDGRSIILNAGNTGYKFQWNTGATKQKITIAYGGTYSVMVTDPAGCFTVDSVFAVVDSLPHPDFYTENGLYYNCKSDSFRFISVSSVDSSGSPLHYQWEFGDGTTGTGSAISKKYEAAGSYPVSLAAISSAGCSHKMVRQVMVNPLPKVYFDLGDACQTSPVIFTNNSSGVITDNYWDFGNGDTSSLTAPVYEYPDSGKYIITLTVANNFGCRDSLKKPVIIFGPGQADFTTGDANVCVGNLSVFHNASMGGSGSMTYSWDFGNGMISTAANPIIQYKSAGTYQVTLVAATSHGCTDTIRKPVTIYPVPVSDFTFQNACLGDTVKLINKSTVSSADSLSFVWKTGDGTMAVTKNVGRIYGASGSYRVNLVTTSLHGCKSAVEKNIQVYSKPVASFTVKPVCKDNSSRLLNASYPDDGSLSFRWDPGDGNSAEAVNPVITYPHEGTYKVTLIAVTAHGCSDTATGQAVVNPLPVVELGDSIFHCGNSYLLDAGDEGVSYKWSTNAVSQTLEVIQSGTYSVEVTSASGCKARDDVAVNLNKPVQVNLGGTAIDACDSVILDAGYPGGTYLWNNGENTRKIRVTETGEYAVVVQNQGCSGSGNVLVTIHTSPVMDLGAGRTACEGSVVSIDAGNHPYKYTWSTGDTGRIIKVISSGIYSVAASDINGCRGNDEVTVSFNPLPVLPFNRDLTVCGSTTLDAGNPGASWLWNNGAVTRSVTVDHSGTYRVQITSGQNCSVTDSVHVKVNPFPGVSLGNDTALCNGEQLLLDAQNAGSSWLWNTGESSETITVTTSGTYEVKVINDYNCSAADAIHVTVYSHPDVDLGDDLYLCKNQQALLDAGDQGVTYQWSGVNNFVSDQKRVVVSDSGLYRVRVTNSYGCWSEDSVAVRYSDLSINAWFLAPSYAHIGDTVQFVDVSYPAPVSYLWEFDDGVSSISELPNHVFYDGGIFRVRLTVSNNFCSDTLSKPIDISGVNKYFRIGENDSVAGKEKFEILKSELHPNPTDGRFIYELQLNQQNMVSLSLFSAKGLMMYHETIEKTSYLYKSYDFSRLKPGTYIFRMVVRDQVKTFRIIKI